MVTLADFQIIYIHSLLLLLKTSIIAKRASSLERHARKTIQSSYTICIMNYEMKYIVANNSLIIITLLFYTEPV